MFEINKIYCADCIEFLKGLPDNSVDFILTDPPFNVGLEYADTDDNMSDGEYSEWCFKWLNELYRVLQSGCYAIIFTGDIKLFYIMSAIYKTNFMFHHFLKWNKPGSQSHLRGTVLFCTTELAFILSKEKPNIKKINKHILYSDTIKIKSNNKRDVDAVEHKASRPVKLYKQIIEGFNANITLDCFMGSGTTAIACKELNKNFIGCDISKKYVEMANKRLSNLKLNKKLIDF